MKIASKQAIEALCDPDEPGDWAKNVAVFYRNDKLLAVASDKRVFCTSPIEMTPEEKERLAPFAKGTILVPPETWAKLRKAQVFTFEGTASEMVARTPDGVRYPVTFDPDPTRLVEGVSWIMAHDFCGEIVSKLTIDAKILAKLLKAMAPNGDHNRLDIIIHDGYQAIEFRAAVPEGSIGCLMPLSDGIEVNGKKW